MWGAALARRDASEEVALMEEEFGVCSESAWLNSSRWQRPRRYQASGSVGSSSIARVKESMASLHLPRAWRISQRFRDQALNCLVITGPTVS